MIQKVDELNEPIQVGKYYWVPHVLYHQGELEVFMPVINHLHDDDVLENPVHYHIDNRFDHPLEFERSLGQRTTVIVYVRDYRQSIMVGMVDTHLIYLQKRCISDITGVYYPPNIKGPKKLYNANRNNLNLKSMKCPHKGYDLSNQPVVNGVIECPLHGYCFNAKTGKKKSFKYAVSHQSSHC